MGKFLGQLRAGFGAIPPESALPVHPFAELNEAISSTLLRSTSVIAASVMQCCWRAAELLQSR
jgi:hypothetical protein